MRYLSNLNDDERKLVCELYYKYRFLIFKIAKDIVQDIETAEDMVSETYITIMTHIDTIQTLKEYQRKAYIIEICKSVSLNYVVKRNRQRKRCFLIGDNSFFDLITSNEMIEESLLKEEEFKILQSAISKMPKREQILIRMKYFERKNDAEIAIKLKIKPDSVRFYLTKARRCLLRIFNEM